MALLTVKQFAALCHTTPAIVRTNKKRGRVVVVEGYVDTEDEINNTFFEHYNQKFLDQRDKQPKKTKNSNTIEPVKKVIRKKPLPSADKLADSKAKSKNKIDWAERKAKAEAIYKERQAELQLVQLQKLAGKLIPTDLVFNIMLIHNKAIFAEFQNALENYASIYCDILAGGDRKYLAEISGKLAKEMAKTIKKAEKVARKQIKNAVAEYSQTRSRGEKK